MAILNNIAFGHEMKPIFQYGFYAGTFGEYDLGAIRWALAGTQSSAGASHCQAICIVQQTPITPLGICRFDIPSITSYIAE